MKYTELDKAAKHPRGTMEYCKDCKTRECFKDIYCYSYFTQNFVKKINKSEVMK